MLALSCSLPAPRSDDLEMRIQVQVVHLTDHPRKHWWENRGGEGRKGGQPIKFHYQASYHCGHLELSPAWTSGNLRHILKGVQILIYPECT